MQLEQFFIGNWLILVKYCLEWKHKHRIVWHKSFYANTFKVVKLSTEQKITELKASRDDSVSEIRDAESPV